jgi:hypothetical protein
MVRPGVSQFANACVAAVLLLAGMQALAAGVQPKADKDARGGQDSQQWRMPTPEELAMTAEPRAPGASAIYLYTQVDRDDTTSSERTYRQIKVLSEDGRNLANVTINYNKEQESILDIEARLVQPDGTIVPFSGTVYDRPLAKSRELGLYAKSFTLQDVRIGSVIEYRFRHRYDTVGRLYHSRWLLSQDLFTRHAKYSLRMDSGAGVRWSWPLGLPEGTVPPKLEKNVVRMEIRDVPAFITEDYMPPAAEIALSVNFTYVSDKSPTTDPIKFWADYGGVNLLSMEKFMGDPKGLADQLGTIIAPGDSNEQKVRKIYSHVQQLNNINEPALSGEKKKDPRDCRPPLSAREVAKFRCGNASQISLYFTALVRAAGIPAAPAFVASRKDRFFQPQSMLTSGLTGLAVAVTIDGREVWLQPGMSILPFGSLPWTDTAVPAFKLSREGAQWITTPMPKAQDAATRRKAKLVLSDDGTLEGTVTVRHSGHEAIQRLVSLRQADEQARADVLIEDLRETTAVPAEVVLLRQPDWATRDAVIETEYRVKVPQWTVTTGNRIMLGIGLFGKEQAGKFVSPNREHPIYFDYPFTCEDEVEIALPSGYKVQSAPPARSPADSVLGYATRVDAKGAVVSIRRALTHEVLLAKQTQYPRFRTFYELVRTGDQEQLVLAR